MMSLQTWELLANYESFELARREYLLRHGRAASASHARELSAPFVHARSYFRSASNADLTVKPLLLYYGILSLARGLVLSLSRNRRESTLAQGHGLGTVAWNDELSKTNPDFAALSIEIYAKGSFLELATATNYRSILRKNSQAGNQHHQSPPVATGARIGLGELLSRIPKFAGQFAAWKGDAKCLPLGSIGVNGESTRIEILKEPTDFRLGKAPLGAVDAYSRASAEGFFEGTGYAFESESASSFFFIGVSPPPGLTDRKGTLGIGTVWLVSPYASGVELSKLTTAFAIAYFLGMLVRYYPTQWTALVRGQIFDAALPTLSAAVDFLETEFPDQILDFLRDRTPHGLPPQDVQGPQG